jgi:spore coat polysaccharide biosynthesis protein SpsF
MKKITAIIQARVKSTRLPNKVLLKLSGKTVLERVIERVKASKMVCNVIVATTVNREDLAIVEKCARLGISVFCGSENDVLDRYYQAARLFEAKQVVRITSDCPLIDPRIIDQVVKLHLNRKADYTSNTIIETYPDGEDVEVFSFTVLERAWKSAKLKSEREHVTAYIKKNPRIFKLVNLESAENLANYRWTLDEARDYKLIKAIYRYFMSNNLSINIKNILEFLQTNLIKKPRN